LNGATENYSYESATGNLDIKAGVDLNYTDANHKHAVTNAGTNTYLYDANGNQITRTVNGQTFNLGYDAENRMVSVTGPSMNASFVYDGDGARVKSTINGVTTSFVGQHYEVTNNVATKYYFAGTSRIAMQTGSTLTYLLTDHLNSTSITTNSTGGLVSELRYKPWGETRFTSGTTSTKYQYTGQFSYESDFGLMFYNARFYDSQLGRFTSADTIIPGAGNSSAWDRYAYTLNNPLKYTDPTGHDPIPWSPFSYHTLVFSLSVSLKFIEGITISVDIVADKNTIFSEDPHAAMLVRGNISGGIEGAADGALSLYGTNDSVETIANNNVSTILDKGVIPAHIVGCDGLCLGVSGNIDPSDPEWRDNNQSPAYIVGYGAGVDAGLNLVEAKDWFGYDPKGSNKVLWQLPINFPSYAKEAYEDLKIINSRFLAGVKKFISK
jgi:RHS repeat-associated protein